MRSPLWPRSVTGTRRSRARRGAWPASAAAASRGQPRRAPPAGARHSAQRMRNIWCRTLQPSSVSGTRGSCMRWSASSELHCTMRGLERTAFGRFTQALRARCGFAVHFDRESKRRSLPREPPRRTRSRSHQRGILVTRSPSSCRARRGPARLGLRRRAGDAAPARPQRPALRVRVDPGRRSRTSSTRSRRSARSRPRTWSRSRPRSRASSTDVRFREGDHVGPATVLLRIDPERYRLEAERAKAALRAGRGRAGPGRRPTCSAARRSPRASCSRPRS